ncbi:hypothetical protein LPJ70_001421 [Coemansia sp. RSA 2708]|nr:hypothetical protein LPJ70_001421 [Coemansia sp. RSA 2708]
MTMLLLRRSAGLRYAVGRHVRLAHGGAAGGTVVFEAQSGKAIRMLKFMSLTGATIACTATAAVAATQASGSLDDADLSMISMLAASLVSVTSTLIINKAFGSFVTRIVLLPTTHARGVKLDARGLPKFDSILSTSRPNSSAQGMLSGRIFNDTEMLMESPGVLGLNSRTIQVRIQDLVPSAKSFRTWELTPALLAARSAQKQPTPLTSFTVLWKTLKPSPRRKIMEEISSMIGPV